ncbi:MAG: cysteine--tRNA ligase [Candidatus Pacearchaeota archaeon]
MVLKLYNTLTRKKETFKAIGKEVKIYVCGPTVNDVPHLGHARSQITFDILRKYLLFLGYKVKFVSNVTDIEDKIINKANELNESIESLTKRNLKAHLEDYSALGIAKPDIQPFATKYVKEMIELIKKLYDKKYAYVIDDDGVYFDISKFKGYGKLSHQNIENLQTGKRIKLNDNKKNKEDFVLWKFSKANEPTWKSPWGDGRPGWHIECSAMSEKILGLPLDIHGGGQDLIFPHHEDEIAQSEAGFGKKFANYWIHNGMVNVDNVKMSKSLGNFRTIRDLLKEYKPEVIRYFVISNHYRKPVDFSKSTMENAKNSYESLKRIISSLLENNEKSKNADGKINKEYLEEFKKAMDSDMNTPEALAVLWKLVRDEKASGKIKTIEKIDEIFSLNLLKKEKINIPKEIKELVEERETARSEKNWKLADELRAKINKLGYKIDDTNEGVKITKM